MRFFRIQKKPGFLFWFWFWEFSLLMPPLTQLRSNNSLTSTSMRVKCEKSNVTSVNEKSQSVFFRGNYWTQVSLVRSMGPSQPHKLSKRPCWNLTDVTLADEDTSSIQTDNANSVPDDQEIWWFICEWNTKTRKKRNTGNLKATNTLASQSRLVKCSEGADFVQILVSSRRGWTCSSTSLSPTPSSGYLFLIPQNNQLRHQDVVIWWTILQPMQVAASGGINANFN